MRLTILLPLCALLAACAGAGTTQPGTAAAQAVATDNPYRNSYVSRLPIPTEPRAATPRVQRGTDKDADYQRLLEQGYDLLGYSAFEAGDVDPQRLNEQARALHADLTLVYTRRLANVPASVRMDQAKTAAKAASKDAATSTVKLSGAQPAFYEYYAAYWTRLPAPLLGVHVQRDSRLGRDVSGLEVIAVIQDSPAAAADIRKGDTLLRLGDVELRQPQAMLQAARRYAGQRVEVVLDRSGVALTQKVQLNAPR